MAVDVSLSSDESELARGGRVPCTLEVGGLLAGSGLAAVDDAVVAELFQTGFGRATLVLTRLALDELRSSVPHLGLAAVALLEGGTLACAMGSGATQAASLEKGVEESWHRNTIG